MSVVRRLDKIKKLAKAYYVLEHGVLIENHIELLRLFTIKGSIHTSHPHKMVRVYISRKALKHVVERRKEELSKNHTDEKTLESICFAVDSIQNTITDFTLYEYKPPSNHFYTKDYSNMGKPSLRILLEVKENRLEIKSIHFTKNKKK
jgi:hypothetical protein